MHMRRITQIVTGLLSIYLIAFAINYIWEMLKMPFYRGMSFINLSSYFKSYGQALVMQISQFSTRR